MSSVRSKRRKTQIQKSMKQRRKKRREDQNAAVEKWNEG